MKIYVKRGATNYKEKKLIRQIEAAIGKNPDLAKDFKPANSWQELRNMHLEYCSEDASVVSSTEQNEPHIEKTSEEPLKDSDKSDFSDDKNTNEPMSEKTASQETIDPFNKEEPIIRDYVLKDEYPDQVKHDGPTKTDFQEPVTFDQAFRIPDGDIPGASQPKSSGGSGGGGGKDNNNKVGASNSDSGGESAGKKKRKQQRFAKYIVEAVCMLAEKGFVWYANKDINESKLAEYEVSGEIDLTMLVTLQDGQEATIKQFFQSQCFSAETLSKFSKEEKEDLTDALVEVLIEKNFEPTASQNLALVAGEILVKKGLDLFVLTSQTNSLLAQLKGMRTENTPHQDVTPTPVAQPPEPTPEKQEPVVVPPEKEEPLTSTETALNDVEQEELSIIENSKETKE